MNGIYETNIAIRVINQCLVPVGEIGRFEVIGFGRLFDLDNRSALFILMIDYFALVEFCQIIDEVVVDLTVLQVDKLVSETGASGPVSFWIIIKRSEGDVD